jgi:hypothetical protein
MGQGTSQEDATLLDVLIDAFEKNEIFGGYHWRELPMPDTDSAVRKFATFAGEAKAWKGQPAREELDSARRIVAWRGRIFRSVKRVVGSWSSRARRCWTPGGSTILGRGQMTLWVRSTIGWRRNARVHDAVTAQQAVCTRSPRQHEPQFCGVTPGRAKAPAAARAEPRQLLGAPASTPQA